jgi:serine/threonine protein kinase
MITGELPWTKRNQRQLFNQIRKGEYTIPESLSPMCRSFIGGLMTVDPAKRATAAQALEHEFLSGIGAPLRIADRRPGVVITAEGVDECFRQTRLECPREAQAVAS